MNTEVPTKLKRLAVSVMRVEDWPRWLAIDANFQPDFEHYRRRMETTVERLEAAGVNVIKVEINPDEFLEWSKANGGGVGTMQRAHYATMKAAAMDLH